MILLTPYRDKVQVWLSLLQQWTYRTQHLPLLFSDPFTLHPTVYFRLCQTSSPFCLSLCFLSHFSLQSCLQPSSSPLEALSISPPYPTACPHSTGPTGGKDRRGACGLQQHHTVTNTGLLSPTPVMCAAARDVLGRQRDNFSATNTNRAVLFPYLQVCALSGRKEK